MEFLAPNGRLPPGFRFHPTDVELVVHYLKKKVLGKRLEPEVIAELDIYHYHPEDLKDKACLSKDLNWFFFCPRERKYGRGERTKRATDSGFWKATGKDRTVSYRELTVGKVKTLVYHQGKPNKCERTDWVMHEFRLDDDNLAKMGVAQDSFVLCKIFKKSGWGPKNGEQYGAPYVEEEWNESDDDHQIINNGNLMISNGNGVSPLSVLDRAQTPSGCYVSASTPMGGHDHAVDQEPVRSSADVASTSKNPVSVFGEEVNMVLSTANADDLEGSFNGLEDLDGFSDFGAGIDELEDLEMYLDLGDLSKPL